MEGGRNPDRGSYSCRTGTQGGSGVGRRTCLKLFGVVAASATGVAAGSDSVRAATDGYGEVGYGRGAYGGSGFGVSTLDATGVDTTSARLSGELSDLGGMDSADCYFEWRSLGASSWKATATQVLSTVGPFVFEVGGLSAGTDYEYRAVVTGSSGDTAFGNRVRFTTEAGSTSTAPSIDSYSVTEAGSPNPHCEITAEWGVSDPDGDLDTVVVEVSDDAGTVVDSATTRAAGNRASGTDEFSIKHANGQTFGVTVTVTDARGDSDSRTWAVTE